MPGGKTASVLLHPKEDINLGKAFQGQPQDQLRWLRACHGSQNSPLPPVALMEGNGDADTDRNQSLTA